MMIFYCHVKVAVEISTSPSTIDPKRQGTSDTSSRHHLGIVKSHHGGHILEVFFQLLDGENSQQQIPGVRKYDQPNPKCTNSKGKFPQKKLPPQHLHQEFASHQKGWH